MTKANSGQLLAFAVSREAHAGLLNAWYASQLRRSTCEASMFAWLFGAWARLSQELRKWSFTHFVLDFGLATAITTLLAWVARMPWPYLIVFFLSSLATISAAIAIVRQHSANKAPGFDQEYFDWSDRQNRQSTVNAQVWYLYRAMPTPISPYWRSASRAAMRALFKPSIADEFDKCFKASIPEAAASAFLRALAVSLKDSDLRRADD